MAKLELFNNLRKSRPASGERCPGYVHLPRVYAEYVLQLCAEQLVTVRDRRGYARREWRKLRERNEALDCYVYARAAAAVVGLDRMSEARWAELAENAGAEAAAACAGRGSVSSRGAARARAAVTAPPLQPFHPSYGG
jgi:phage terminase large subunit GpA-like protein